jgi:hypothetical protein
MPNAAAKALRGLAPHLVQEAELLRRPAHEALAEAKALDKRAAASSKNTRRPRHRSRETAT